MAAPTQLMRNVRQRLRDVRLRRAIQEGKGTPREAVVERTHVGPHMDTIVARTKRRMQPAGIDADYDLAHEHFDVTHFLLQARQMLTEEEIDPLAIFLANGAEALASPEINFNMAAYLERYPARADGPEKSPYLEWLKRGKAAGEIADPAPHLEKMAPVLGMQPRELVDRLAATRTDLQQRLLTGTLGEMFARAAEVEPLIGDVWGEATQPMLPPLQSAATVDQVAAIHACQQAAGFARARLVLVLSDPRWGGGRRAEGHITHALTGHLDPEDIVVIYTDGGGTAPRGRFPAGVREVDFATAGEGMPRPAARRALVELIRSFRAEAVVTIASRLFYEAMTPYGKAMAASERIFLVMFCNERVAMGNWVGLPLRYFYRYFDLVEGVITDSDYLANWLRDRHQLAGASAERIHVLHAPVDPDYSAGSPAGGGPVAAASGVLGRALGPAEAHGHRARGRAPDAGRRLPDVGRVGADPRPDRRDAARERPAGGAVRRLRRAGPVRSGRVALHVRLGRCPRPAARGGHDRRAHRREPCRRHRRGTERRGQLAGARDRGSRGLCEGDPGGAGRSRRGASPGRGAARSAPPRTNSRPVCEAGRGAAPRRRPAQDGTPDEHRSHAHRHGPRRDGGLRTDDAVGGPRGRSGTSARFHRPADHRAGCRHGGHHDLLHAAALRPLGAAGHAGGRPRQGAQCPGARE